MSIDVATIAKSLHQFFEPDDAFEVRILGADDNEKWKKSVFMRGRDIDRLAGRLASEAASATAGIHFTPQGIDPEILRQRGNCVIARVKWDKDKKVAVPKLTHNTDVPRRRFLIVDVDPVRAAGFEGDSATKAERIAAWNVAEAVREFLRSAGWADPLLVSSGNGFHCYYRLSEVVAGGQVDSSNDPLAVLLKLLAHKFNTTGAKLDDGLYVAGHTLKVPGTPSRKGPNTNDRPHRMSSVVEVPDAWDGPIDTAAMPQTIADVVELLDPDGVIRASWRRVTEQRAALSAACKSEGHALYRASCYLATLPPAVSGLRGHAATYRAASAMAWGFELAEDIALDLLMANYNPRCEPPWSEDRMRHKVHEALTKPHREPRGYLLNRDRQQSATDRPELDDSAKALLDGLCKPRSESAASDPTGRLILSPPACPATATVGQVKVGGSAVEPIPTGPGEIDDPFRLAGGFKDQSEWEHLRDFQGEFVRWEGGLFRVLRNAEVENPLRRWTEGVLRLAHAVASKNAKEGEKTPPKKQVTTYLINNTIGNLRSLVEIRTQGSPPMWIDGVTGPNPAQLIPLRNGLYDVTADALLPHSPAFLTFAVAPFDYDREAPRPTKWLNFLAEVWPDDPDSIACLQEWFGYLLTPDTSMQKILFLLGPPRAGKGTIAHILEAIVGPQNVTGPMLSTLAMDYAVAGLVGKSLALIGDARLSGRTDSAHVAGVLNTISGEDKLTIPRKYKDDLQVRLTTRFVILSNELPRILDSSGALSKRVVMLQFTQSFVGRENRFLSDQIISTELPGILLWAIEGWRRLREKGQFTQPQSARESLDEMEDLGSPVRSFLRERCVVQKGSFTPTKELFAEWRKWCEEEGRRDPGTLAVFGRDLKAVESVILKKQPRIAGVKTWCYIGVRLKAYDDEQGQTDCVSGVSGNSFIDCVGQEEIDREKVIAEATIKELPEAPESSPEGLAKHQFDDL